MSEATPRGRCDANLDSLPMAKPAKTRPTAAVGCTRHLTGTLDQLGEARGGERRAFRPLATGAWRGRLNCPWFPVEPAATLGGPRQEREAEMTFDEEKRGWAFAGAEGLDKRIAACEKLAETDAQREELASMRRRLAEMRGK